MPRYSRGNCALHVILFFAVVLILAMIAVPNFLEAQTRAKIARAKSDMRSLATALEAYYIDKYAYPTMTTDVHFSVDYDHYPVPKPAIIARTFHRGLYDEASKTALLATLTTPLGYITYLPPDPFGTPDGIGLMYYVDRRLTLNRGPMGAGWILSSVGPNRIDDMGFSNLAAKSEANGVLRVMEPLRDDIEKYYDSHIRQPSPTLLGTIAERPDFIPARPKGPVAITYDPTNGIMSDGNVWRVRQ